jgi:hypothetical protein
MSDEDFAHEGISHPRPLCSRLYGAMLQLCCVGSTFNRRPTISDGAAALVLDQGELAHPQMGSVQFDDMPLRQSD